MAFQSNVVTSSESIDRDSRRQTQYNGNIVNRSRGGRRGFKKIHTAMSKLFSCGEARQHDDEYEYDDYPCRNDKVNITQRIDIIRRNNGTRASF